MSGVPGIGLSNPIARGLLAMAIGFENFARRWNRQPPLARGGAVRPPTRPFVVGERPSPFPPINHRDEAMGFKAGEVLIVGKPEDAEDMGQRIGRAVGAAIAERDRKRSRPG